MRKGVKEPSHRECIRVVGRPLSPPERLPGTGRRVLRSSAWPCLSFDSPCFCTERLDGLIEVLCE